MSNAMLGFNGVLYLILGACYKTNGYLHISSIHSYIICPI